MADENKDLLKQFTPKEVRKVEPDRMLGRLRYSPCGKLLAAGGLDGTVRRWDLSEKEPVELPRLTDLGGWVNVIGMATDCPLLFAADSWGQLAAWPYAEREAKPAWKVEKAHNGWIRDLAVSRDGKLLVTGGLDRVVRVWSATDGKLLHELVGHQEDVYSVAIHPDGAHVVSGDLHGVVHDWDLATRQSARKLDAGALYKLDRLQDCGGVRRLEFDASGKLLAAAGTAPKGGATLQGMPTVLLFDWASGKQTRAIKSGAEKDALVHDVRFHPAGFFLAVSSGVPGSGQLFFARPGDEKPFYVSTKLANCHSVDIHPDGQRFIVTSTNTGSNGNGRKLDKDGKYPGNRTPMHLFEFPSPTV